MIYHLLITHVSYGAGKMLEIRHKPRSVSETKSPPRGGLTNSYAVPLQRWRASRTVEVKIPAKNMPDDGRSGNLQPVKEKEPFAWHDRGGSGRRRPGGSMYGLHHPQSLCSRCSRITGEKMPNDAKPRSLSGHERTFAMLIQRDNPTETWRKLKEGAVLNSRTAPYGFNIMFFHEVPGQQSAKRPAFS